MVALADTLAGTGTGTGTGGAAVATACPHCGAASRDGLYCCAGCAAAHAAIRALGLDDYYRRRDVASVAPAPVGEPAAPSDCRDFVQVAADGTCQLDLMVEGLHCAACVWLIETALARRPEIDQARLNMTTRRLHLAWRGSAEAGNRLAASVERLGYRVAPYDPAALGAGDDREGRRLLQALAVSGFAASNIMMLSVAVWLGHAYGMGPATRDLLHWASAVIALPAIAIGGLPFFRGAWRALAARRTTMDVPIALGVAITTAMSLWQTATSQRDAYFDSAAALLFFLLIGRYLDHRARGRARDAVTRMVTLQATAVQVIGADGTVTARRPGAVAPGMRVLVAAGDRLGVDGIVRDGRSTLDASLVTGETLPQPAGPGDRVYAGMVNRDAALTVEATAVGAGTLLAEIVRMIEAAESRRGRYTALADRLARRYAPVVHVAAAATFLGWLLLAAAGWQVALTNAVAVLIVTCPCALALAVPVVQIVATGRLMRDGILVKTPTALERLAAVDMVVFDKTGTLTEGRPVPRDLEALPQAALRRAAALAASSRHPLARALVAAVPGAGVVADAREVPGQGIAGHGMRLGSRAFCGIPAEDGEGGSELWFVAQGEAPLRIVFDDPLRPDAGEAAAALRGQGLDLALLSGDRAPPVAAAAAALGIADAKPGVTPADKVARLEALAGAGRRVLMVGDGLNDAPALAAAHVSMSPVTATEITQAAADLVFQGRRLRPVGTAIAVARRAQAVARQNLVFALLYNLCVVPLAVAGQLTPILAAAAMSGSSLVVILNSLRLGAGRRGAA